MKWFGKLIISSLISFVILNVFSFFYYNVPPRTIDKDGVTEYKWPSNTFYSRFTEGIAWGETNNDGFNNILDYDENTSVNNLIMGSSQVEGFSVSQNDNLTNVLNNITDTFSYNIGVSEHTLPICVSNLENAIKKYKPTNSVVIETMTISFYDDQLIESINGNPSLETYSNSYIDFFQNFKYLKLVYYQLSNLKNKKVETIPLNDTQLLSQMLLKAKSICDKYEVKLIIVFHPTIQVDANNETHTSYNLNDLESFTNECKKQGIIFINMEEDFIDNYNKTKKLPHGFINTTPGIGHLNSVGFSLIANRLKRIVEE